MNRIRLNLLGGQNSAPKFGTVQPVQMANRVSTSNPMHSYLGHFAQPRFMSVGHNTVGGDTKKTGSFHGKSNKLGHGGRAAQLRAKGVPGAVIGAIARRKGAAPGGPNYHGK